MREQKRAFFRRMHMRKQHTVRISRQTFPNIYHDVPPAQVALFTHIIIYTLIQTVIIKSSS